MDIGRLTNQGMMQPTGFQKLAADDGPKLPADSVGTAAPHDADMQNMRNLASMSSQQAAQALLAKNDEKRKEAHLEMYSVWSYDTSGSAFSDTVFDPVTKTMYTGVGAADKWHLTAFDENGNVKWSYADEKARSTPVLDKEGNVYFRTDTHLRVLTPDGKEKWSFETDSSSANSSRPVLGPDGTVYLAMQNSLEEGSNNIEIAAVKDGKKLWRQPASGTCCQPQVLVAQDGTVVLLAYKEVPKKGIVPKHYPDTETNAYLTGFDPKTGAENFRTKVGGLDNIGKNTISQGPDGTFYIANEYDQLSAYTDKGEHRWNYKVKDRLYTGEKYKRKPWVCAAPGFDKEGNVYLTNKSMTGYPESYLICLDSSGREEWCTTVKDVAITRPHCNEKGEILLGSNTGKLLVFDKNGKNRKQYETGNSVTENFAFGNDGVIYLNTDKKIIAFQPDLAKLKKQKLQEKGTEEPVQSQVPGIQLKDGGVEIDGVTLNKRKKKLK